MKRGIFLLISGLFFLISCKKEEQSCYDGVFDPEFEEEMDCGGVCPPCNFVPTPLESYLKATINGKETFFTNYGLNHTDNYHLNFKNDTIHVYLNLGNGDTLGARPIEGTGSSLVYKGISYNTLVQGISLFDEVDTGDNFLSGYFDAKFLSINGFDTVYVTGGRFSRINF